MQNNNKTQKNKGFAKRCSALVLAIVLLLQSLVFGTTALASELDFFPDDQDKSFGIEGIGNLTQGELTEQMRNEILKSMNENLVKRIEESELSGPVGLIVTFSDDSIISEYTSSGKSGSMSYSAFKTSSDAKKLQDKLRKNQSEVLGKLEEENLIDEVRYSYVHLMDGAFVTTTYENIKAITAIKGVERVMVSNRYLPLDAVNNPVDVYDTGIFNSGSVSYTGKGTLVAILDTGCDYSHTAFTTYTVKGPAYDRAYVESKLAELRANGELYSNGSLESREVFYGNLTGEKIVFGYDYADKDPDIMPFDNSHGTHVAGIIAGKDDKITGVAIDAQLAIMKVFSDYKTGAEDGDVIAALEDSIILGVDAINMSLGAGCGFTEESDADKLFKNEVYENVEKAGISLVVAASNDYSSGMGGENSNTNKTENPDSGTVGSPATYGASMSVASINGQKDHYMLANGSTPIFFTESNNNAAKPYDFFEMLGITKGKSVTYEYVAVPGVGIAASYTGIDVKGKIALVKRGDNTFEEKVQYAEEAGAIAVIIYNNIPGTIHMTIGNHAKIPAVSINKDDGDALAAKGSGTIEFSLSNEAGPFMSDFSSWGPSPDLSLKPDITAHGGNILSAVIGNDYEEMSGTSMASPNMCGITVLIRQYVNENFKKLTGIEKRDLVNQLCMSTATIALDKNGNPYSPRKQGAGIADIRKSTTTSAYLFCEGSGRTKFELGDDPQRTGVYTMKVGIKNVSSTDVSYKLGNIVMTESVSVSEPEYVAEIAYILSNTSAYTVSGDGTIKDGVVTVSAGKTAFVTVTITLSDKDKSYLNSTFENGMFVEGYVTFDNTKENGVDLNAPFLAFYGDWGEAPIFDLDFYEVETEAHNNAIDDEDKIKADYYATTPLGTYYYDYVVPLGSYLYKMDENLYNPIPATRDKAAISYFADSISGLYAVYAGLLRGAKEMHIEITNATTGKLIFEDTQYNCYKSYFRGAPAPYAARILLDAVNAETGKIIGDNNTKFEVTMTAKLDWDKGENTSDTYSFSFYIDYEAPTVTDYSFRTEYDKTKKENRYYLDLMVYDNHYAMSCRPVVVYETNEPAGNGQFKKTYSSLCTYPIPVYQDNIGEATKVSFEITDYLEKIANSSMPNGIAIYVDDYAMNSSLSYIPFPGTENEEDVEFNVEGNKIDLDIHETTDLTKLLVHKDSAVTLEPDYLKTLKWSVKSGSDVVMMKSGQLEALKQGTAVIAVTSDSWVDSSGISLCKELIINVSDTEIEKNPNSSALVKIEDIEFSHYKTLFAHNTDIDYSGIGKTGNTSYFGGNYDVSCYPMEQIQLFYQIKPWNLTPDRYKLTWTSSNKKVATVDENGVVTAQAEGTARIRLNIAIDGKTQLLTASLTVEVKSEFIIENRTLVAYKGKGGDVVIPEDEGILYIGKYAFCHYDLDNEKYVEKDENGYYEIDEKKTPLKNTTVTSVKIPEGVETIQKHAFRNCLALTDVILPESCITIEESAFESCTKLKNVNFDNVKIVGKYAFRNCERLSCYDLGGANTEKLYAAGDESFAGTAFTSLKLTALSRIGVGAFMNCKNLAEVELGERTRISAKMFKGSALNSIVIWSDTVSDEAFMDCERLTEATIKNDLTYLGAGAFMNCKKLADVTIDGEIETIAYRAFANCSALTEFTLPKGNVAVGESAFDGSGLKKLIFSPTTIIDSLGMAAFATTTKINVDIKGNASYKLDGGAIYTADGKTLVMAVPSLSATEFTVPANVTTIGDGAFSSLTILYTVKFADGSQLSAIGDGAFSGCEFLTNITLPAREITIGDYAFYNTSALKNINLTKVKSIGEFAFWKSGLTSATITTPGVTLGSAAFLEASGLKTVTLGEGAVIGEFCFRNSGVVTVALDGDATISDGAFYQCMNLESFDFANVTGEIGADAFWACTALEEVNAPGIVKIGDGCFADCYNLTTFKADNLEVAGIGALSTLIVNNSSIKYANKITELSLPSLKSIGEGAFYLNTYLEVANLPKLSSMGNVAFYNCVSLEEIIFSEELNTVTEYAFYGCRSLKSFDVSNVENFEEASFYGVPLPEHLNLNKALQVETYAFYFDSSVTKLAESALRTVSAPNLSSVGVDAFAKNSKLHSFSAPSITAIGNSAFAYTGLTEFEVGDKLETVELGAFQSCNSFTAFYKMVGTEKKYDGTFGTVKLDNGTLYLKQLNGYALSCYPAAKTGDTLTVLEGTINVASGAAFGNKNLKKVVLPSTLKSISDYAFFGCDSLNTVVFKSYYAPTLEGTRLGESISILKTDVPSFPGFEELYGFDYYFRSYDRVTLPLYYRNFIDVIGSQKGYGITAILPDNCEGYDSLLYTTYFDAAEETSGVTMGKYAIAFIDAVNRIPAKVDRFDKSFIDDAIVAYNALEKHSEEKIYVDDAIVEKYNAARSAYNVNLVESKIVRLYDIYKDKYSFDKVKEARAAYLALSEGDKAKISKELSDKLTAKITDLNDAFGTEIDFNLNYEDYISEDTPEPPANEGLEWWAILLIVVGSVVIVGGAATVVVVIIIRKKKKTV